MGFIAYLDVGGLLFAYFDTHLPWGGGGVLVHVY